MLIDKDKDPDLFRLISDRNLLSQYDYLVTTIMVSLEERRFPVNRDFLCELNKRVVTYISPHPGEIRRCLVGINNSNHIPPDHADVSDLLSAMFSYIERQWDDATAVHLSAYALWRINWIHPFVEGNGRTARALSYFIICAKLNMLLPGKNIIPQQIRANRSPYYAALAAADEVHKRNQGAVDVSELESYVNTLLTVQLSEG